MIRKPKYKLKVIKSSISGFGIKSLEDIPKNKFIIEYHGKTMSQKQSDTKNNNKYFFEVNSKVVVDGSTRKNLARYINHSCRPNSESRIMKGKIYIYSKRKIKEGEELCYDYGKEYFNEYFKSKGCKCAKCKGKK